MKNIIFLYNLHTIFSKTDSIKFLGLQWVTHKATASGKRFLMQIQHYYKRWSWKWDKMKDGKENLKRNKIREKRMLGTAG